MALVSVSQLSVHFVHGQFHPHPLPSSVINTRINQPQRRHMLVNSGSSNFFEAVFAKLVRMILWGCLAALQGVFATEE